MTAPTWHDLPLRIITPTFIGKFDPGTDPPRPIPFPVPSLRGNLAYWLRALIGAHTGNDIAALRHGESAVFGAARAGTTGGPSAILLRAPRVPVREFPVKNADPGVRYLLGPGLLSAPPPRCLGTGQMIPLRVKNTGSPAHADLFLAALWALRTFGGIGARARRGLGTVAVESVPTLTTHRFVPAWLQRDDAADLAAVLDCVKDAMTDQGLATPPPPQPTPVPRYPCFAPDHHIVASGDELPTASGAAGALAIAGQWLYNHRHGGRQGQPGIHHSATYSSTAQPFLNGNRPQGPLLAGALGLPIPYSDHQGPGGSQRKAMVEVLIGGVSARRASPLWLRVRKDGGTWRLRSLAFLAEWLPPEAPLRIKSGHRSETVPRPTPEEIRNELTRWFSPPDPL
jgi:hypothetical protein